jgi:hypothetical protein
MTLVYSKFLVVNKLLRESYYSLNKRVDKNEKSNNQPDLFKPCVKS